MADFKTEINEIKVLGKIETTEVKATIVGYSNPGKQGLSAYDVAVNEGFVGSEEQWLISLIGPAGQDGREVELRKTDTFVQWKYIDDVEWTNLIALSELKGPQGNTGLQGPTGPEGPQGNTGEPGYTPQKGTDYFDGLDIMWKGTYDAEIQYQVNDAIFYEGSSYICILESLGNLPTNTMYFNIMAQQGQAGAGTGDMLASVYDPDGKQANAFDYGNFTNTPTFKTINEQSILGTGNLDIIGVEDGDKGDVVVSDDGETWTIDNNAVTNGKLANMNANTIKGRISSLGEPQDLTAEQVRTIINVEDGSQVNNIIELEELPTASSEYIDNLYKIGDKLYVCVAETTLKHIEVGDNLNSKTIYCGFPFNFYSQLEGEGGIFIDTDNGYYSFNERSVIVEYEPETVYHWCSEVYGTSSNESIYSWDTQTEALRYNYNEITSNKGVVTSIDIDNPAYQYMQIQSEDALYEWKEYGGDVLEKATGAEVITGTDDEKYVTPKAISDSNLIRSTDDSVTNIRELTKAEYDALTQDEKDAGTFFITDDLDGSITVIDGFESTSTTDPGSAKNDKDLKDMIDNVTKYITATAASNGDFKVTLKGTLSSGDIVNISFPTPTNSSSNARLSVDNGVNYYNIKSKSNYNILSISIENSYIPLVFDGTNFVNIQPIKKLLWLNPNPANSFAEQTITLATAYTNYDSITILFDNFIPYSNYEYFNTYSREWLSILQSLSYNEGAGLVTRNRFIAGTSNTSMTIRDAYQNGVVDNTKCVPINIYGIID